MQIQGTESIDKLATGLIRRSPNIRLLTLFSHTRPIEYISLIGDYPLIAHLIDLQIKYGFKQVSRWSILKTVNASEELASFNKSLKTEIVEELLRIQRLSVAQI